MATGTGRDSDRSCARFGKAASGGRAPESQVRIPLVTGLLRAPALAAWLAAVVPPLIGVQALPLLAAEPDSARIIRAASGDVHFGAGVEYAAGTYPCSVVIGLLNADPVPDLVVADYGSNSISVLLG